jgi:hypothetical protein
MDVTAAALTGDRVRLRESARQTPKSPTET